MLDSMNKGHVRYMQDFYINGKNDSIPENLLEIWEMELDVEFNKRWYGIEITFYA
jgi:hypothetical protein